MLQNSYQCLWCKKDLRGRKLSPKTSQQYYDNATNLSNAIELWNVGYECTECGCQWAYKGNLIKEGIPKLKNKHEVKSIEKTNKSNTDELENNKNEENK